MWHSPKNTKKKYLIKFKELKITKMKKKLTVRDSRFLPLVTKVNPWVSIATPVLWTCSSMYLLTIEKKIFFQSFTEKKIPSNYLHKVAVSYNWIPWGKIQPDAIPWNTRRSQSTTFTGSCQKITYFWKL